MLGIPLGLLAGNFTEWFFHKNVLHKLGKKKKSFWRFHWSDHHAAARKNKFYDKDYEVNIPFLKWNAQGKEAYAILGAALGHLPLFPIAPFYTTTLLYCAWNYYRKHKRSHLDTKWGRENLRHHYEHHMGKNQDKNWCVTHPFFDFIMGTSTIQPPDILCKIAMALNEEFDYMSEKNIKKMQQELREELREDIRKAVEKGFKLSGLPIEDGGNHA